MKSEKYCAFCINIIKLLKKFATVYSGHYNNGRKYDSNNRSQNLILTCQKMLMKIWSMKLNL